MRAVVILLFGSQELELNETHYREALAGARGSALRARLSRRALAGQGAGTGAVGRGKSSRARAHTPERLHPLIGAACPAGCVDLLPVCEEWRSRGYCLETFTYNRLSINTYWCPSACNTCSTGIQPGGG